YSSSSATPRYSGRNSAPTMARTNATPKATNATPEPPDLMNHGTASGAMIEARRPKAAALPEPVPRSAVGSISGLTADRPPHAPRLNADSAIPAARIVGTVSAWPKSTAATAEPARKPARVARRPHFSMRKAARAYPGSWARVMISVYSKDATREKPLAMSRDGIQMKAP